MELKADGWCVEIAPQGGAIRRASWRGFDILRPYASQWDPFAAVCNASFTLVPYSNRIRDGRFNFEGEAYEVPSFRPGDRHGLHGVGWLAPWTGQLDGHCRARMTLQHEGSGWPWRFDAEQIIEIEGDRLSCKLNFINTDDRVQPVGLGFHPYFPRDEGTRLTFASHAVWVGETPGLSEQCVPLPEAWRFESGRALSAEQIDHCFVGWSGEARIDWPGSGLSVVISASNALNHVVVFTPTGEPYFCFEPVSHMSNAIHHLDRRVDTGLKRLEPGEQLSVTMSLTAERT